jgi:hypothetical protein
MSRYLLLALFSVVLLSTSCKKDNVNQSPIPDAGASQTITLPTESVTLAGTGKDPDGKIVSYLWSQVAGPSASAIVDPGASSTVVGGLVKGSYIFQLSVWDNLGGIGVDTMVVIVNPSPVKTLTLQPDNNPNEYGVSLLNGNNASGLTDWSIDVDAWTRYGEFWIIRCFLKFDLGTIPSTATIKAAHLYLYSNPAPITGDQVNANSGPTNSFTIQQLSADWSPSTTTWFNQPAGLTNNQIIIPSTTSSMLDLNVDVTAQVASMVNNNANYGFVLKLQSEVTYNSRIFVASHNQNYPDKHPKLVVEYQ